MSLMVGQSVYWKRTRMGTNSIRRVPAIVLQIAGARIQIELGEPVDGVGSTKWVNRGSLERRPVTSSGDSK